jgi:hypothetical protein
MIEVSGNGLSGLGLGHRCVAGLAEEPAVWQPVREPLGRGLCSQREQFGEGYAASHYGTAQSATRVGGDAVPDRHIRIWNLLAMNYGGGGQFWPRLVAVIECKDHASQPALGHSSHVLQTSNCPGRVPRPWLMFLTE